MKRPELPYDRPCTMGELAQLIEYYLDPDDKELMLFEDDIAFGIFAGKREVKDVGMTFFQEIRILTPGRKVPVMQAKELSEDDNKKFYDIVEQWISGSRVKQLLQMIKKEDPSSSFDTGVGHSRFSFYLADCKKAGLIDDTAFLSLFHFPSCPGSKALEENKLFKANEDGSWEECKDEKLKREVLGKYWSESIERHNGRK